MLKGRKWLILPTTPLSEAPNRGTHQNFSMKLILHKLEGWGYCMVKIAWS